MFKCPVCGKELVFWIIEDRDDNFTAAIIECPDEHGSISIVIDGENSPVVFPGTFAGIIKI